MDLTLDALDSRIRTLLPELYQDSYESLQPVPMRSAGLKYAPDGRVAWDEMWGSFCDLAMAGGPPHKGALLGPGLDEQGPSHRPRGMDLRRCFGARGHRNLRDLGGVGHASAGSFPAKATLEW